MNRRYTGAPVVVVGGGPVGQTAALLLARWGVPCTVLEQRPARDPTGSRAICHAREALEVWTTVGAGRQIAAEGLTWRTARTYHRGRELASWSFVDRDQSLLPPMVNLSQARVEQVLGARLDAAPLVTQRWGHEVTHLTQEPHGVALRCRTGGGATVELTAPYVILATGAHSAPLHRQLGVSFAGETFEDRFLIADVHAPQVRWRDERRFYFDPPGNPGRQVLVHPCPGDTFRIDWQVPPGYDLAAEECTGALDARVRAVLGPGRHTVVWRTLYRFHARCADRLRVGRVLLAGDCAHLMAPFGARGLNSGVADAENAAWKIAFVLHGWSPPQLLETYHTERHAAARENLAVTAATMRFLVPHGPDEIRRRQDLLARAREDRGAAESIDSGRFAEPFWYVASPLTTPDPTRPFAGRPPRGHPPAVTPGVLLPDAPAAVPGQLSATGGWLRSRARDGLLFLVGAGVRADIAAAAAVPDAPTRVQPVGALDAGGALTSTLGIRPAEVWVVRPDGHVAATLHAPTGAALAAAARRALGFHLPTGAARAGTGEAAADGGEPGSRRAAGGTAAAP